MGVLAQRAPDIAGASETPDTAEAPTERTRALVASMHDAPLALQHCDRIIGLRDGQVQFDLPSGEITEDMLTTLYLLDDPVAG